MVPVPRHLNGMISRLHLSIYSIQSCFNLSTFISSPGGGTAKEVVLALARATTDVVRLQLARLPVKVRHRQVEPKLKIAIHDEGETIHVHRRHHPVLHRLSHHTHERNRFRHKDEALTDRRERKKSRPQR